MANCHVFFVPSIQCIDNIAFIPSSVLSKLLLLKKSTAVNPDSFPPIVLHSCAYQLSIPLSIIYNVVFTRSELPSLWLASNVIPLYKKKGQRNLVSNYRPISISSSCCKVMESIIKDFILKFLVSNHLITDHQHGFLKGRSTVTNLLNSIRHWLSSLNSGKSSDIIYVDFAKAFDSVSHSKLLQKLRSYGIRGKLLNWISAWLSGRTQSVKIQNISSAAKPVLSGVLQGSVLGPLLFLIFINDLVDDLDPSANPTLFADDLKLFSDANVIPTSSDSHSVFCPLLQNSLNKLHLWCLKWQLQISISKCAVLSISNSRSPKPRRYSINSHPIPEVTSYSDLGVIVDNQLTFSIHVLSAAKGPQAICPYNPLFSL